MRLEDYKGFDATRPPEDLGWDQLLKVADLLGVDLTHARTRSQINEAVRRKKAENE